MCKRMTSDFNFFFFFFNLSFEDLCFTYYDLHGWVGVKHQESAIMIELQFSFTATLFCVCGFVSFCFVCFVLGFFGVFFRGVVVFKPSLLYFCVSGLLSKDDPSFNTAFSETLPFILPCKSVLHQVPPYC